MRKYILETVGKRMKSPKLHKRIELIVNSNNISPNVDFFKVVQEVENKIDSKLTRKVDVIYIIPEESEILSTKKAKSLYLDGAIFLTDRRETNIEYVKDIIHEIAHAFENAQSLLIYGDGTIEQEFLTKRKECGRILECNGYKLSHKDLMNPEYDVKLDHIFNNVIGYEQIRHFCGHIFIVPYMITSIHEYFACGLEEYFGGSYEYLNDVRWKQVSPKLFEKMAQIGEMK